MAKPKRIGRCHLCGMETELTLEHVPPQKAFNDSVVLLHKIDAEAIGGQVRFSPAGTPMQGGNKAYTLCGNCNNNTGSWYGRAYVEFVGACAQVACPENANRIVSISTVMFPLRIMKQALVIMCSSCGPGLAEKNTALIPLLLNKTNRGLPHPLRLFAYIKGDAGGRISGISSIARIDKGTMRVIAEFSWWPLGLVLSFNDVPIEEATEVTHWLKYDYDKSMKGPIHLPCRWAGTPYPLDYRSPQQVIEEASQQQT